MGSAGERAEERALRVPLWAVIATAAVLAAAWALDLFVLRTGLLAPSRGRAALTPLYAFWGPSARPAAIWFPIAAIVAIALAPRLVDEQRTRGGTFAIATAVVGAACALALFLVRTPLAALGTNFDVYSNEEFWHDAARIQDAGRYLAHYVELMPQLSTHGRHFPPGHSLLLAGVDTVFGHRPLAAGVLVLACAAAALPVTWLALRHILSERAARQGTLLVALCPAFLDFACTSMDAVFFLAAAIASWLALRALAPGARMRDALLGGVALFVAANFSFSTLPLGFALALGAVLAHRARAWRPLAILGATFAACVLVVWIVTGFAWWECFFAGHRSALEFMDRVRARHANTERWRILYGNAAAFAIGGGGCALVTAAGLRLARVRVPRDGWTQAFLVTFAVLVATHFLETERIWLYAVPGLAVVALADAPLDTRSWRILATASIAQTALMEVLLFTLW